MSLGLLLLLIGIVVLFAVDRGIGIALVVVGLILLLAVRF